MTKHQDPKTILNEMKQFTWEFCMKQAKALEQDGSALVNKGSKNKARVKFEEARAFYDKAANMDDISFINKEICHNEIRLLDDHIDKCG